MARRRSRFLGPLALLVGATLLAGPAGADVPAPEAPPADATVGVVTGDLVNLRVGPRQDDSPILQLEQGTVVVIVERAGEWLGVRVPAGFQAAIAAALTEPVDSEHVRVTGAEVNLRVKPPQGDTAYAAFRDKMTRGQVLPVIVREGDWIWVEAPEAVRAYVHSRYVKEVGPVASNGERIDGARRSRVVRERLRSESAGRAAQTRADEALRAEVGAVGSALLKLRAAGGYDNAPIGALADRLASSAEAHPAAPARTKALVRILTDDLEREMAIRTAYADQIVAYKRVGREPPPFAPPPAPRADAVEASGVVRWEPIPGWEGGGVFLLEPETGETYAIRWAGGDLKTFDDGKPCRVKGKTLGGRLVGFVVLEVATVTR
jgi:hypothetical protein